MTNLLLNTAVSMIASAIKINPRVLEFGLNFVSKSKKEMTLTPVEIECTKVQILNSIKSAVKEEIEFAGINGRPFVKINIGEAFINESFGALEPGFNWFTHITKGIVGGFDYTLKIVNDEVIAECLDTWDFNPANESIRFKTPKKFKKVLESLSKALSVPVLIKDYNKKLISISIVEKDLMILNKECAFQTKWEVNLGSKQEFERIYSKYINLNYTNK